MLDIAIANEQRVVDVDERRLRAAVELVMSDAGVTEATISLAIVDDEAIHVLNRRYLDHDEPTDVLSFVLEEGDETLDGEIVASGERAAAVAPGYGWSSADELLLYVVHGALHLVGHDDQTEETVELMRAAEAVTLAKLGVTLPERSTPHDREQGATAR